MLCLWTRQNRNSCDLHFGSSEIGYQSRRGRQKSVNCRLVNRLKDNSQNSLNSRNERSINMPFQYGNDIWRIWGIGKSVKVSATNGDERYAWVHMLDNIIKISFWSDYAISGIVADQSLLMLSLFNFQSSSACWQFASEQKFPRLNYLHTSELTSSPYIWLMKWNESANLLRNFSLFPPRLTAQRIMVVHKKPIETLHSWLKLNNRAENLLLMLPGEISIWADSEIENLEWGNWAHGEHKAGNKKMERSH